jgi:glycosyltransferase involved in cell wall biosynthesis
MVEGVERAGHTCVLYLYDRFRGELSRHERVIREGWPALHAEIRSTRSGLAPLDAYVANGFEAAHVLASRGSVPTRRLYFIQDFEPWFFPVGTEYLLAEDSYRFGFRPITVGRMIADILSERFGVTAAVAEFGCDTSVYRLTNTGQRRDVVFYGRRDTPRRGFELGVVALREFHKRHPHHGIHVFGDPSAEMPFSATNHGRIPPARLSELYNQCVAGIALSFTNASLVPDEMLACGAIPVVGDSVHARACLDNPYVRWAHPSPLGLADALSEIVTRGSPPAAEVAGSVQGKGWDRAQRVTLETIEDEVYGPTS